MDSEPCTYSPEPAADCSQTASSAIPQSAPSNSTRTAALSCESEPPMAGFPVCECTRSTFGCSIHPNTPDEWIASQEDFLALMYPSLAQAPDWMARNQGCGRSLSGWFAQYDRSTHSLKTAQRLLFADSTECSVTLPRSGSMRNGRLFQRPMSERRIGANASGFSRIADASARFGLACSAAMSSITISLVNTAAQTAKAKGLIPTLTASDWKTASKPGQRRGQLTDPAMGVIPAGGKLNPAFAEWLMGWPIGWTELKHSATAKSRSKPRSRGES